MDGQNQHIRSSALEDNALINDRYLIVNKVATGGMGNIYRANDLENSNLPIALKMLHKGFSNDPQYIERFKREVELCQRVNHPNVVKVFDLVTNKEMSFFTMEFIEGVSLEDQIQNENFSTETISRLIIEVCDGLRAIHEAGIIHRDIKPANLMQQPDGSIKIIDFGISRGKASRLTAKNVKVGSILYIPPEIWLSKPATKQSDFYSLGVMLYELCTGEVPFFSDNPMNLMEQHVNQPVPDLPTSRPLWMNKLIKWLMEKDPKNRPKDSDDIIRFIHQSVPHSQSIQTFDRHMSNTVRSGQGMLSVFDSLVLTGDHSRKTETKRHAVMFSLQATRPAYETPRKSETKKSRSKTILLKLPNKAAIIFEFEIPSKDFLFLGIFLASLNIFDWYLTREGMNTFGVHAEGNDFLRHMMHRYGVDTALASAKGIAIFAVFILTYLARRSKMIKDLVGTLSIIYLCAAVIPWIYILYYRG